MKFDTTMPMPERVAALPRDFRGFPVPWFVAWVDDKPQFPIMDGEKFVRAIKDDLCWVCGEKNGSFKTFVIGPMCAVNHTSAEPPSHFECAKFAVKACPFLVNRNMKRVETVMTKQCVPVGGEMIKRNPGVALLWTTKSYRTFKDGNGGVLINFGPPTSINAWAGGEPTCDRKVVEESVTTGLPLLEAMCENDKDRAALQKATKEMWAQLDLAGIR